MVEVFGVTLAWPVLLKLGAAVLAVIAGSVIAATWLERTLAAWARRRGLAPDGAHALRVRRFLLPLLLLGALHATLGSLELPATCRPCSAGSWPSGWATTCGSTPATRAR